MIRLYFNSVAQSRISLSVWHLILVCLIVFNSTVYGQNVFTRVSNGYPLIGDGKTEWVDLDNDDDLDLVFAGSDGSVFVTIIYENVAGTLTPRATNLPAFSGFAIADYDHDGDIDILGFNTSEKFTRLYLNNGDFSFSQILSLNFSPANALWFDFDNDQDLDFLLVGNMPAPRVWENIPGGFAEAENLNFPECPNCNCDVADVDGDGKIDVMFTGGPTALYLNNGDKSFRLDSDAVFKQTTWGDVACGDFDADGDLDILLTGLLDGAPYSAIYENRLNKFIERTDLGVTPVITTSPSGSLWFNADNDGKIDLLISGSSNWTNVFARYARVLSNNGESFQPQTGFLDSYLGSYDAGDFDNDGDTDLGFQGTYAVLEGIFQPKAVIKRISGYYRHEGFQKPFSPNTKPQPPANATFSEKFYRKEIRLKWGKGLDSETPSDGLFYNFYLRDATKRLIAPSVDFANGRILTSNTPNATGRSGYAFDLPEGLLYYAVQSIDGAKTGSVFSPEKAFYHMNGPEAVRAEFTDQQHVKLSWVDHSSVESNFEILRSESPASEFASRAVLPPNTISYQDNFSFDTETKYYYRIRGYNGQASAYDSLVLVIPNRPSGLSAKVINASTVHITWEDKSQYETAYVIERRQGSGDFEEIAAVGPNVTQFSDFGLLDGITYEYRVVAQGENGALAPWGSASATTNARPKGIAFEVSQDEDKRLKLTQSHFNNHFTDANPLDKLMKIKIVGLPENGTLYVYTSRAVVGQEVTPDLFNFLEFDPDENFAGITELRVRPHDGTDYSNDDWIITLRFRQVNDPPVFDLTPALILNEDFVLDQHIRPQMHYFPGEEDQVVTFTVSPQVSDVVNVTFNPALGEISLSSMPDMFGEVEFTLTANDGQAVNNTYSRKLKVMIKAVNDPPVFAPIPDVETESSPFTLILDVKDPDNNLSSGMFFAYSSNTAIVKRENIKFKIEDQLVKMIIIPERSVGETNISVFISDGNYQPMRQFKFSVLMITSVEEDPATSVMVYPNPVFKELEIHRGSESKSLGFNLTDIHGRSLKSGTLDQPITSLDLGGFSPGLYLLKISGDNGKIIVKKIEKL